MSKKAPPPRPSTLKRVLALLPRVRRASLYMHFGRRRVQKDDVLLLSTRGEGVSDDFLRLCRALCGKPFDGKSCWLGVRAGARAEAARLLREAGADRRVRLTRYDGVRFLSLLARAGTVLADDALPPYFLKRPGQRVVSTWRGTPFQPMGMDDPAHAYAMGDIQRSLLLSDFILVPNEPLEHAIVAAYGLDHLYRGTVLRAGAPRCEAFFDREDARRVREALGLEKRQWIGVAPAPGADDAAVADLLKRLGTCLPDDQRLIVAAEGQAASGIGKYALLNACDALVTDDPGVMTDFACAQKPIVAYWFAPAGSGARDALSLLPPPLARSPEEVASWLSSPPAYDMAAFARETAPWACENAAERLLRRVLLDEKCLTERRNIADDRENVLLFASTLPLNGLTSSLVNLLSNIDLARRNYFVTVEAHRMGANASRLSILPAGVHVFPIVDGEWFTWSELLCYALYFRLRWSNRLVERGVERLYRREWARCFGMADFACAVQFAGYGHNVQRLFGYAPAPCRRVIYVHNDMEREIASRGSQHADNLRWAYRAYDDVAIVSEDLRAPTRRLGGEGARIALSENTHAYARVRESARLPIAFDDGTASNLTRDALCALLDGAKPALVTIGRFSPEKGHLKLIEAFRRFAEERPDAALVLIGGHGPLYDETLAAAERASPAGRVAVIRSLSNPMPVLARCDLFLLASEYEGMPMVLLEADSLGLPVVSTDVTGPRGLLTRCGGTLVDNSVEGLLSGMRAFMRGEVKPMGIDFEAYNRRAVSQFEEILSQTDEKGNDEA